MKWYSVASSEWRTEDALEQLSSAVESNLGSPDLLVVFVSRAHQTRFAQIPQLLRERFPGSVLIGCSARGVIGGEFELEEEPSVALVAARLPGVQVTPFRIDEDFARLRGAQWKAMLGPSPRALMLLTDSFSCDTDRLLDVVNSRFPGLPVFGGLASSASHPGANALFLTDQMFRDGGVGVAFSGDCAVQTVVAQGCRAVGDVERVERADGNVVVELEGGRPDRWVDRLMSSLTEEEKELVPRSLFVGVKRGNEWLIRTIVGYDPNSGAMTLTERVRSGDEVRFFLRDARTSREDLREAVSQAGIDDVTGGFFFSCIGRGKGLYGTENHDTSIISEYLADAPVGGFFCAGEFGPVDGKNYVHGYTSTLALFRSLDESD